ncbi:MAG: ATP-binding cassette domain-containing protein [Vicinamibacteria bacterium]|jgi:phospholipid/cholesterol/gamma-HCH transport system ATP-binding protein|nr:ATP-binding cassette domain-containing protein [Vicinamibacteria bacterium]
MIEYREIHKAFDVPVLTGVNLSVVSGETMAIVGPSGTGKSVLLKTTIGLIVPDEGDVIVDGQSLYGEGPSVLAAIRLKVGYVFQNAALFDSMTVYENVVQGIPDSVQREISREEMLRRVCRSLEDVNLDPWQVLNKLPAELSGGMRKRVGLARTIVGHPQIILYDEPVTGLDPVNSAAVERLITQVRDRMQVTSLVVTHDIEGALSFCDRIALLDHGKAVFVGTPEEFRTSRDPLVRAFADRQAAHVASLKMMQDESHGGDSDSWQRDSLQTNGRP